jgi:APA family basic amino acid/polyamine antiporter
VRDPARTIPRAVVIGTITVTLLYLAATAAVMLLVPAERLAQATAPFAEAARGLGPWGPHVIAAGALVATAGSLNGVIFIGGQMPMAVALDGLAHPALARRNAGRTPVAALLVSSVLGSLLLLSTVSRGFVSAFTFLTMMATLTVLAPLLVAAAAELRFSWRSAKGWAAIAALAGLYCFCAILGSGLEVIAWGLVLLLVGIPLYVWGRKRKAAALAE